MIKTCENVADVFEATKTPMLQDMQAQMLDAVLTWREQPLRIAVIGGAGCGKSSFINAIRGLGFDDTVPGFAAVDVQQTTTETREYAHPLYNNLSFYDIPGVGTPDFPMTTYIESIGGISNFDFFMIVSANRFTEHDTCLIKEIYKNNKTCYYIRTKVDIDVQNNEKYNRSRESTVRTIRENVTGSISEHGGVDSDKIPQFLISNHDVEDFDFPNILKTLTKDVTLLKTTELAKTFEAVTADHLHQKYKKLQERRKFAALKAAAGAAIPVVGFFYDILLVRHEKNLFRKHFGTDITTVQLFQNQSGHAFHKMYGTNQKRVVIARRVALEAASFAGGIALKSVPCLGILTAGPLNYYTVDSVLDLCYEEAKIFHNARAEWLAYRYRIH